MVFLNQSGSFRRAVDWEQSLGALGQVTSAVLVDMDEDGDADLLVSRDLGAIGLYHNRGDRFVDVSEAFGMLEFVGLWQGLAVGDFDNDGRVDFAAGNLGRNSPMELYPDGLVHLGRGGKSRLSLYAIKRGSVHLPVDDMDLYANVVDRARLPAMYRQFSDIDLAKVLDSFDGLRRTRLNCFETSVFLNRGGKFERRALPYPAQFSPTSGINVADFDNDGREDLLLSQNLYSLRPDWGRLDSSAGMILLGQGDGRFEPVRAGVSGLAILGDSRNAFGGRFQSRRPNRYRRDADVWPNSGLSWAGREAGDSGWICSKQFLGPAPGRSGSPGLSGWLHVAPPLVSFGRRSDGPVCP